MFIINVFIKGNYENYNILSYIIVGVVFSIPFVIIKLSSVIHGKMEKPQENIVKNTPQASLLYMNIPQRHNPKTLTSRPNRTFEEEELSFSFIEKYQCQVSSMEEDIYDTAGIDIYIDAAKFYNDSAILEIINKCDKHIDAYEKCRNFCYSKGEGGKIYFQDMWECCHNSRNECFGYSDDIYENREILRELLNDNDRIITNSLEIIENTNNIDELCKYYDIALKHAVDTNDQGHISQLSSSRLNYILDCYDRYIGEVKTEKAKQNRKAKFFETLKVHLDKDTINTFESLL